MISGDEKDFIPTGSLGAENKNDDNWSLHAEYQRYQEMLDDVLDNLDSDYFGIGFNYTFSTKEASVALTPVESIVESRSVTQVIDHDYLMQTKIVQFDLEDSMLKDAKYC